MRKYVVFGIVGCLLGSSLLSGCSGSGLAKELTGQQPSQSAVCIDWPMDWNQNLQRFSDQMFQEALEETNPVMSPFSAYLAMGMTGIGATGETKEEFETLFGVDMKGYAAECMGRLPEDTENLQVLIANSAWVDDQMEASDSWLSDVQMYYKGAVYQLPLEKATADINKWVENNTKGLIDSILDEPLSEQARLALINTIYFNGNWKRPFDPASTQTDLFTRADGSYTEVSMMCAYWEYVTYMKGEGYEGVVLPYMDSTYAFVAVKPTDEKSVRQMYESISTAEIAASVKQAEDLLANLKLPKFEVEFARTLNQDFIDLGLKSAFDSQSASFDGLGASMDGGNLYVDRVLQKAVIRVDEEGTEAAAVTIAVNECAGAMPEQEPKDLFFDEPFLYMIYDQDTEIPLFVGIFDEPQA